MSISTDNMLVTHVPPEKDVAFVTWLPSSGNRAYRVDARIICGFFWATSRFSENEAYTES